jgi:hypothetical protein
MKPRLKIEPRTHTSSMEKCDEFIRMNTKKEFDAIRRNSRTSPKTPNKSKSTQQRLFIEKKLRGNIETFTCSTNFSRDLKQSTGILATFKQKSSDSPTNCH